MSENISLFQVAFGGLTLAAIAFLIVVAEKLARRDFKAERKTRRTLRKKFGDAHAVTAFRHQFIYDDPEATKLRAQIKRMPNSLASGYVTAFLIYLPVYLSEIRSLASVYPLLKEVANNVDELSMLVNFVAISFTIFVGIQVWVSCRRYVIWLNRGAPKL